MRWYFPVLVFELSLWSWRNPGKILTTGSYTLSLLKRETEFKNISILGSIKSTSVVVKNKLKFDGACLIAPEALSMKF